MRVCAEFADAQHIGATPLGTRRILQVRQGTFAGPRLNGDMLRGGGDWLLVRQDGVAMLDIRFTLRTEHGQLIYVRSSGISDMAPQVRERIMAGADVDPAEYYFRTSLAFETGAAELAWLNRLIAVGVGTRTATGMVTDVHAVR